MKVSIIGAAGSVGAPTAFHIATSQLVDEIVMIDARHNVVQQHAMDLSTAVSSLDVSVKAGVWEDLAGSTLVINAAGVQQGLIADRMDMLPKNLSLACETARQIRRHCPSACVISATNPVDPLNYAIWRAGNFDRHQLIGYSFNDSLRFREMVALAKSVKASDVEAIAIGEHGGTQVLLFSSVRIQGQPVRFSEAEKQNIQAQVPTILRRYEELQAGRTAGWTCAVGLAAMVRAVVEDSGALFPCSVVLDGEYGQHGLSISVPVLLGRRGVRTIPHWQLDQAEQAAFAASAEIVREATRFVDERLS